MKMTTRILFAIICTIALLAGATKGFAAPDLNVRAGIHDRYNRIVFDWKNRVDFDLQQNGNLVSIQFTSAANANLKSISVVKPPLIRNVTQQNNDKGLLVTFQIPDKGRIESFRSGQGVAFDILHMNKEKPKFSESTTQQKTEPAPDAPAPVIAETVKPEPKQTPIQIQKQGPKLQTLADHLAEKPPEYELVPDRPIPQNVTENTEQVKESKPPEVTQGTLIRLVPGEMTKLAVFTRAGKLWLVLDKPLERLTPTIHGENIDSLLTNASRINVKNGAAFVFDAPPPETKFSIRRQQNEWQIWLNSVENTYLPDDMAVNIKPGDAGTLVSIYAGENPTIVTVKDTTIGDRMEIVPVRTPEGRIVKLRQTQDYKILPTMMGAVIVPQSDIVEVGPQNNMVVISGDEGKSLQLSSQKDREQGIKEAAFTPIFTLKIDNLPEGSMTFQRQILEKQFLKMKTPDDKAYALLDLVRLNIRHGFGPEAEGLLRVVASVMPAMENTREYQALSGMAAALSGDLPKAKAELASDTLQSQPMAKLWMGYALANHYEWPQAHAAFIESGNVMNGLPESLKIRVILAKAETALMIGDIAEADKELAKLHKDLWLLPAEKAAKEYIEATSAMMIKDKENSLPVFEELSKGHDQLYKVKSQMALTNQQLVDKTIKLPEAIKAFERLRFEWRNDRLEIDILRRLGQLYVDNGQYMDGLTIWRQAASLSKNTDDTDAITSAMQRVFTELYVNGGADKLQPLQAVALFERFRELNPSGDAGNVALAHLADRLAAVDLLDQADSLLEKQIRQNAVGEQAATMGAKLASWRLQNRNPSGALKTLDESTQEGSLPESLSQKRLLLRAKALADLGRTNEALSLLNTLQSPESLSLKADINWRQNRWADTAEALLPLINYYRDKGETSADGLMPPLILKMAIALTLDDNRKGIELLTAQYGEFMNSTKNAQAFNLITKPTGTGNLADMETLTSQVGEVELFQKFLKDFGK